MGVETDQFFLHVAAVHEDIENNWGDGALAELFFGPIADIPG